MGQRSTVAKLPKDAQAKLRAMYDAGLTLDDIHEALCGYLEEIDGAWSPPSRSAIHRHRQDYEATASKMREAREMASAIATELGDIPDDKTGQLLIDLLRTMTFKVLQGGVESGAAVDPKDLHFLGRTLKDVASAGAIGTKQAAEIRKLAREEAAKDVEAAIEEKGGEISPAEIVARIRGAYGVQK